MRSDRRAQIEQRIRELNARHITTVTELNDVTQGLMQLTQDLVREVVVSRVLTCFTRLVEATPVDTGRLRAGWMLDTQPREDAPQDGTTYDEYRAGADIEAAVMSSLPAGVQLTEADTIYIMNNVEYVLAMNAGWSKNASHAGFIDVFLVELKKQLELAASDFANMRV